MKWMTFVLLCVASLNSFAQFKWEYGIQTSMNTPILQKLARDTFSPKASVGANLFTERLFSSFGVRSELGYKQNRYSNDVLNRITVTHAFELNMKWIQSIDSAQQTFLTFGILGAYAGGHNDFLITGEKLDPMDNSLRKNPLHLGVQTGFELTLSPGKRLTLDYTNYLNSRQNASSIEGRIGHVSVGLQYRIREYSNSKSNIEQYDSLQRAREMAFYHRDQIRDQARGIMIFVLPSKPQDYFSITKSKEEIEQEHQVYLEQMISTIHSNYGSGTYIITTDSLYLNKSETVIKHIDVNQQVVDQNIENLSVYYGFVEQGFIDLNGSPKWGLFVYNSELTRLKSPFPFYIPYRTFDTEFKSIQNMIKEFDFLLENLN